MPHLNIIAEGDGCWPDALSHANYTADMQQAITSMALLPGGMASGKAAVVIRIDSPDGRATFAQVSLDLLRAAVRAFDGRAQYLAEQAAAAKKGGDA